MIRAEGEGFEPPVPRGTTVFKTAAFDHSANPLWSLLILECKYARLIFFLKENLRFFLFGQI